jgi:7,8-dihydro-6-hydroxymethylpterin-pyrophosphokinase
MAQRWLLLLGSSLAGDGCVRAALQRLGVLGDVTALTPIRRLPTYDGSARVYHNLLAVLACAHDLDAALLAARLKRIEAELGRRPGDEIAIDIDILAMADGARWKLDAHALAKREFEHPPALTLLAEANLHLDRDADA